MVSTWSHGSLTCDDSASFSWLLERNAMTKYRNATYLKAAFQSGIEKVRLRADNSSVDFKVVPTTRYSHIRVFAILKKTSHHSFKIQETHVVYFVIGLLLRITSRLPMNSPWELSTCIFTGLIVDGLHHIEVKKNAISNSKHTKLCDADLRDRSFSEPEPNIIIELNGTIGIMWIVGHQDVTKKREEEGAREELEEQEKFDQL